MYSEKIMNYFLNPINVGEIENADGVGEVGKPKCGEVIKIYLRILNDTIIDVKFKVFGDPITIATSSIITEIIKGKTIQEVSKLEIKKNIEAFKDLPIEKINCPLLVKECVDNAIKDYLSKNNRKM